LTERLMMRAMADEVLVFPTSFSQKRLWFLEQLVGGQPVYHVSLEIELGGAIDLADFSRALNLVLQRHEALRTTFAVVDGEPVQVVRASGGAAIESHDLRSVAADEIEARLGALAGDLHQRPFDLAQGPLLRVALVRVDAAGSLALVVMHHIITDGWSSSLFEEELVQACEAVRSSTSPVWPELPVQYGDFAVWQRQTDAGEREALQWWLQHLRDAPATLALPAERARSSTPSFAGASLGFQLPVALTPALQAVAQGSNATLYMATLAAFGFLLSQHASAREVVIGTPVAGRPHPDLDRTIGFFVNTLALRIKVPAVTTFADLLVAVRDVAIEGFARQHVPFEHVVAAIAPERQAATTPLFQVMFTFDARDDDAADGVRPVPSLEIEPTEPGTAKFDLTLALTEGAAGLHGVIEFNADLLSERLMRQWVRQYCALLEFVAHHPNEPLDARALLWPGMETTLLETWNATATAYPRDATLGELFDEVVARCGDATSVVDGARRISYRDLDRESAALAARLQAAGVDRGAFVGVNAERSLEFVVALLAIVRCGAAYVPLDRDYPRERLRDMVEDTGLRVVVTSGVEGEWLVDLGVSCLAVRIGADEAALPRVVSSSGDDPGYVIFTSGSTGRPKGVTVPHRAIVRLARDTDYVTLSVGDVVAHASNTAFDAATFEVWGALLNGATIVVIPREVALSARELAAALRAERVSTLFITTPLFHQMATLDPQAFSGLRDLLFGGDVVDPALVRRVLRGGAPPRRLLHVYGPTEVTTFATWHLVSDVPDGALTVPIGRPIANTTAFVLDEAGHPVPIGVAGELYLGGDGVAIGYLGQPEATAARFVALPARPDATARVYRTGDLVRWNADGALEFIGRRDRQVKVRGFRVEPGEVEVALAQCPGVTQAAVVARVGAAGYDLIAYVADGGAGLSVDRVRTFARDRLPAYTVPSAFVVLPALPLTANGKIDREALPDRDPSGDAPRADVVQPRNALEETIADVWRAVLQRANVGVTDNFFDLGGHSLLIIQVLERLRPRVGVELGVVDLFRYPSVASLSEALHGRQAPTVESPQEIVASVALDDRAAKLRRAFGGSGHRAGVEEL
jgi:amino acid adenylation domain-containing protein